MCRWLAYSGPPIFLERLILKPKNSLMAQSRQAHEGRVTTNGDGFGVGWFGAKATPGQYRETLPAWNDHNLINISQQVESKLFFAHVRASTGTITSRANCHPFRYENWLFMHNGMIPDFERVRRDLTLLIAPELFVCLQGSTDSEVLFHLMLTNGLKKDPMAAFRRTVAQTEDVMRQRNLTKPFRFTAAATDGSKIYALRYASDDNAPSLYYGCGSQACLGRPDPALDQRNATIILSEPLDDEKGHWVEVPDSQLLTTGDGGVTLTPFTSPDC